ncbi:hypothetical protein OUZ56_032013 [Daphnia magna]|uniref:SpoVT-AbrB domain-containing protein n=1 Tax=Daphnia magna TaxID=35525 RepID=A0ABQ9ZW02_9CRUS|nr:hypothetical protein OUZ56_032013 [Daphnia magna]
MERDGIVHIDFAGQIFIPPILRKKDYAKNSITGQIEIKPKNVKTNECLRLFFTECKTSSAYGDKKKKKFKS